MSAFNVVVVDMTAWERSPGPPTLGTDALSAGPCTAFKSCRQSVHLCKPDQRASCFTDPKNAVGKVMDTFPSKTIAECNLKQ